MRSEEKPLFWVGSSKKELMNLPEAVIDTFGHALGLVQIGMRFPDTKPLKGLGGVDEILENYKGDTFRAVYTAKFGDNVYVLHCFQKKSSSGISTPKPDMEIIKARLKEAKKHAEGRTS
ncbi:MAG: type II toxin-antitoxin system RelE/ParE family toxin [Mariprofundaceae bacterium]|nr:type II toxin-antitoxin system RelE/ParE family toxin [Mariprofundaceae bacterium]